jgi:antitoxin component YwqK of YwqJK toxin-antitoxin module
LDDPETVDELIPKAVYENSLRYRRKAADGLYGDGTKGETIGRQAYTNTTAYLDESPFTGWMKKVWDNGEIRHLSQFKNGKQDGPSFSWYENGQKSEESYWTAGKYNGTHTIWNIEGTVIKRETWNNGYYDYEAVNELNQRQLLRGDQ